MIIYSWLFPYTWDFHSKIQTDSSVNILIMEFELLLEKNIEKDEGFFKYCDNVIYK